MPKFPRVAPAQRTWQFFVVMLVSLLALGATALVTMRRTTSLRQRVVDHAEPAQIQLGRVQGTLALELAAIRGYLLTGLPHLADDARVAQQDRARAMHALAALTDSLGGSLTSMREELERVIRSAEAPITALLDGRLDRRAYLVQLDAQQDRFAFALEESRAVEAAIAADMEVTLRHIRRIDRVSTVVTIVLALVTLVTAALVARLAAAQRQLALDLSESETRFREIADNVSDFVSLTDVGFTRQLYANTAYARIWGRPIDTLQHPRDLLIGVHPDDRQRVEGARLRAASERADVEFRVVRPDGSQRSVWSRHAPIADANGRIYRVATITEDITERKAADERRVRLIRGFSHDVRNPLGAADGLLALMEDGILGEMPNRQLDAVRRARRGVKAGVGLVTQMLDVARGEAGRLELRRTSVRLADVAAEMVEECQLAARKKDQTLELAAGELDPRVESDRARIRQIIGNLISNAIKYTQRGGRITVSLATRVHAGRTMTGISVKDNGVGIAADKQAALFREFVRLAPDAADGIGIGLSISQQVARALGGFIDVLSAEGRGATFTLWLPLGRQGDAL